MQGIGGGEARQDNLLQKHQSFQPFFENYAANPCLLRNGAGRSRPVLRQKTKEHVIVDQFPVESRHR
jgi:hypothetical protein